MKRWLRLVGVLAAILAWGEWVTWRASRRLVTRHSGPPDAVVVLGFQNAQDRANALNRWRVRVAERTVAGSSAATMIMSGGAVRGNRSEASLLAEYARSRGFGGEVVLEEVSDSTQANIDNSLPLLENFDRIAVVSDPLHALRARRILLDRRPDFAERLVRGGDYRFGEWTVLKPPLVVFWTLRLRFRRGYTSRLITNSASSAS